MKILFSTLLLCLGTYTSAFSTGMTSMDLKSSIRLGEMDFDTEIQVEQDVRTSIVGIQLTPRSLTALYEFNLTRDLSLRASLGLWTQDLRFTFSPITAVQYYLFPTIQIEPRVYLNQLISRKKKPAIQSKQGIYFASNLNLVIYSGFITIQRFPKTYGTVDNSKERPDYFLSNSLGYSKEFKKGFFFDIQLGYAYFNSMIDDIPYGGRDIEARISSGSKISVGYNFN